MDVQTWRRRDPVAARYLSFLASTGYQLSEIEQRVVSEGTADREGDAGGSPTMSRAPGATTWRPRTKWRS